MNTLARLLLLCLLVQTPAVRAGVEAVDSEGRLLRLSSPAQRIIALAPHIVENLFSIGAGDQIVAAVQYSDYPEAARAIPRVGGVGSISIERIVAARPELVILWGSGTAPAVRTALERLQLPYFINEIGSLEELASQFHALGVLTGHVDEAMAAARAVTAAMASRTGAPASEPRPSVFLQIWDEPLQTVGGEHLLSEVIARCGGRSISADLSGLAPLVSLEQVLAADPALIIVESDSQARHWQRWPQLQAVRNDGVVTIDPDLLHRPTLRLLDGMAAICARLAAR